MTEAGDVLPDYLQNGEIVSEETLLEARTVEQQMSEFIEKNEELKSASSVEEFIAAFQALFPPEKSYNHDLNSHLDIKTLENGSVDCNSAAILLAQWLEKRKTDLNLNVFFVVKRGNSRNHTFVITSPKDVNVRNKNNEPGSMNKELVFQIIMDTQQNNSEFHIHRLTVESGLYELDKEEKIEKVFKVLFNLQRPAGIAAYPEAAYAFSDVKELILYLVADKGYRDPSEKPRPQHG